MQPSESMCLEVCRFTRDTMRAHFAFVKVNRKGVAEREDGLSFHPFRKWSSFKLKGAGVESSTTPEVSL